MTAEEYHADPAPEPSLSSSIAAAMLLQSPLHARGMHPRLNPDHVDATSPAMSLGTQVHAYILEGPERFAVVDAHDWRTKEAKSARESALADGLVPVLAGKMAAVREMAESVRRQLARFEEKPVPLQGGRPEVTLVWQENVPGGDPVWCRARLDFLHDDGLHVDDIKSTAGSARPEDWIRTQLFRVGYDVRAAFYLRGIRALTQKDATFRWVVVEVEPPFAVSVIGLDPAALAHAEDKCQQAILRWAECLRSGNWPAYPRRTAWAEAPPWQLAQWEAEDGDVIRQGTEREEDGNGASA
jgi:hypothetical protein